MAQHIPQNALIVVADGRKAILFRNQGAPGAPSLHEEQRLSPQSLNDAGPSGSRPEDQTLHQTDEATFAKQLAQAVYKMKHAGAFEQMVLVADPQTLGQFRDAMHSSVADSIVLTLSKDLTNHPAHEIADLIGRAA